MPKTSVAGGHSTGERELDPLSLDEPPTIDVEPEPDVAREPKAGRERLRVAVRARATQLRLEQASLEDDLRRLREKAWG